mmetsp:Transcript_3008/g.6272  ORF Transcript_3008/g.6272 Transcript_3008/m.6272 type:complete len:104 (-) Transcript_3008:89-400(-)
MIIPRTHIAKCCCKSNGKNQKINPASVITTASAISLRGVTFAWVPKKAKMHHHIFHALAPKHHPLPNLFTAHFPNDEQSHTVLETSCIFSGQRWIGDISFKVK